MMYVVVLPNNCIKYTCMATSLFQTALLRLYIGNCFSIFSDDLGGRFTGKTRWLKGVMRNLG